VSRAGVSKPGKTFSFRRHEVARKKLRYMVGTRVAFSDATGKSLVGEVLVRYVSGRLMVGVQGKRGKITVYIVDPELQEDLVKVE
jgi:hypothetical protein